MKSKAARAKKSTPKLYKIDSGIKLWPSEPAVSSGRPGAAALTLQKLENGQSFLVKDELDAIYAAKAARGMKSGGRAFTTRKAGKGVRIWRIQ